MTRRLANIFKPNRSARLRRPVRETRAGPADPAFVTRMSRPPRLPWLQPRSASRSPERQGQAPSPGAPMSAPVAPRGPGRVRSGCASANRPAIALPIPRPEPVTRTRCFLKGPHLPPLQSPAPPPAALRPAVYGPPRKNGPELESAPPCTVASQARSSGPFLR